MAHATQSIEMSCSPQQLLSVITDFGSYPQFLPEIVETRIVSEADGVWEVAFALKIVRKLDYTLRLVQPDPMRVEWSLVEGVFRVNSGSWSLESLDDGTRTRATYEVETQVGMYVPRALMNTLVSRSLPDMLTRFKTRAESR